MADIKIEIYLTKDGECDLADLREEMEQQAKSIMWSSENHEDGVFAKSFRVAINGKQGGYYQVNEPYQKQNN